MQPLSELHKAARAYAEAGIPVFPVEVNGKKPVTPNGFYDATTDTKTIDDWWSKADYNLAMSPALAGLFVVDVDPGASFNPISTYTVQTPRGGFHYYFEGSGPTTASKICAHVDTRGSGGYILIPPSRINGVVYKVISRIGYSHIPDWITEALTKTDIVLTASVEEKDLPINVSRVNDLLNKYVENGNVAIEGQGGDALTYRVCCEVLDFGLSPEKAFEVINEVWNPHCTPPWIPSDLAAKIQNADAYQQNEAGIRAIQPPAEAFGSAIAKLFPVKQSRFYFKDEDEQENEPEPQWIIKDLLSERSTVLLYGPTQSYKSFLSLDIALAISTGRETFGDTPYSGTCFYAALEGRAHLRKARRSWKLARQFEGKLKNFYLGLAPMIGVENEVEEFGKEIEKRCGKEKPKLIILDTLGKAMAGLNENDALDAGKFIRFCDSLVESFQCSVLAIHHTGKDKTRGARGSSAFHAGFDTVIEVVAKRANKAVEVWVRKHKDAEEREIPWTFEGRTIGGSLAFFPTNSKEHNALTNEEAEYSPRKIGGALQALGAYGIEKAVTTNVLALQLVVRGENQDEEEYQSTLARALRILFKAGKGFLEAYTFKSGKQTLWGLPRPE